MNAKTLLETVSFVGLGNAILVLAVMARRRALKTFWPLVAFVALYGTTLLIDIPPLFFRKDIGISKLTAYNIIFYTNWPCVILEAILMVVLVYRIYNLVLAPFEPLRKLGTMIFRWVAGISIAVSTAIAIGPHMFSGTFAITVISQIQQAGSILTLCLLLFVCFALRPLGLTFRSRYFGICLGLGIIATVNLVQAAWIPVPESHSVYSPVYSWSGIFVSIGLLLWTLYFAAPEPKNQMVLLPTTSPWFLWNKVSEAFDDEPGYVAISGVKPASFAKGELDALLAVSDAESDRSPRMMQNIAAAS